MVTRFKEDIDYAFGIIKLFGLSSCTLSEGELERCWSILSSGYECGTDEFYKYNDQDLLDDFTHYALLSVPPIKP